MELDLMEQLERSAAAPAASDSLPAAEESGEDEILELSLWWSSEDVRSRKRVREGDEEIEGKKPKMEVPLLPYGVQVMPMILQGLNGSCYACMVPCWVPCSVDVAQDSVDKSEIKQNFEMGGMVACDSQQEAADDHGLSFRRSSNSGATFSQSSYAKGESNSTNESRNHSKNSTTNNSTTISAFRDAKSRLKKPPTQIRGRKKLALSRKRRALVFTRSAEGNKIDGYLYQCRKKEVRILCDCHGSFFSPADFVRHAGGPETQHPLRQITVVAS